MGSLQKKGLLIEELNEEELEKQLEELKKQVAYELIGVGAGEKNEEELIEELELIPNTKDEELGLEPLERAKRLLDKLFRLLSNEFYTITSLEREEIRGRMIPHLQRLWHAEKELIGYINQLEGEQGQKIHEILEKIQKEKKE